MNKKLFFSSILISLFGNIVFAQNNNCDIAPPEGSDSYLLQDTTKSPLLIPDPISAYGEPGACIKWYDNLDNLLDNSCNDEFYSPERYEGVYTYYATQELNGCESEKAEVKLTIEYCHVGEIEVPELFICDDTTDIEFTASLKPWNSTQHQINGDEIIYWYSYATIITQGYFHVGSTFSPNKIFNFKYHSTINYFVRAYDPVLNCYGPATKAILNIIPIDTLQYFCKKDEPFVLEASENSRWYSSSDTSKESYLATGRELDISDYLQNQDSYWVTNTCNNLVEIKRGIGESPDSRINMDTIAFQGRKELYNIQPMYTNQENTTFSFKDLRVGLNPVTNTGLDYPILSYSADNSGTDTIAMTASNEYCTSTTVLPFHIFPAPSVKFTVESDKTNGAVTFNNESVLELFEEFENEIETYYLEYSFSDEIDTIDFSEPFTKIFPPGEWEVTLTAVTTMGDKRSYTQAVSSEGGPVLTNIESLLPNSMVNLYTIDGKLIKQNIPYQNISAVCKKGIYVVKPAGDSGEGQIIYIQ